MNRYLVFVYSGFYPKGGWNDFVGDFSTLTDADHAMREAMTVSREHRVYGHVLDTDTRLFCRRMVRNDLKDWSHIDEDGEWVSEPS